jgi:hypothetical protein
VEKMDRRPTLMRPLSCKLQNRNLVFPLVFLNSHIRDVDRPSTAILSVFSQPKTAFGAINSRFKQPEVCIGTEVFQISLRPSDKRLKRITLNDSNDKYQLLVIYGTYVNSRVMTLIDNRRIHEGFITVYSRGALIPVSFLLKISVGKG